MCRDMMIQENLTISGAVREGAKRLKQCGIENADYDSYALLSEINGMDRTYYLMNGSKLLTRVEQERFFDYIERRSSHEPLQHILGRAFFYGHQFKVSPDVLIPRPDTEVLVEQVLKVCTDGMTVVDMCTGSGCILLSVALERKLSKGIGVDISGKALAVAKANQEALAPENVTLIQSDLFENAGKYLMEQSVDIVVSNPPYICTEVIDSLSEEVRLHDPVLALDGHEDGLYFYRKITKQAKKFLKPGGRLFYEIGYDQSEAVEALLCKEGYTQVATVKDLAGLDRVVMGRL